MPKNDPEYERGFTDGFNAGTRFQAERTPPSLNIITSDAEQLSELRKALECAVTRLEDNERWWHQARTLTTLTAFEKQAFEARAQTTRTTLDQLRAVLSPAKKAANT